jgi:hypothetical protein
LIPLQRFTTKALRTTAIIGISAAIDVLFGIARVETMILSSSCLYMADAIRLAAGPDSFGLLVGDRLFRRVDATCGDRLFIRRVPTSD